MSEECQNSGLAILSIGNRQAYFKTKCKSWSCRACAKVKTWQVENIIRHGIQDTMDHTGSTGLKCYFTTATYRKDASTIISALGVRKDYQELLRRYRTQGKKKKYLEYFKVIEAKRMSPYLKKKVGGKYDGTGHPMVWPHVHAVWIMEKQPMCKLITSRSRGGLNERKQWRWSQRWFDAGDEKGCECIEHKLSRIWGAITGKNHGVDSPVFEIKETFSQGIGNYLAKYLRKELWHREAIEKLGFVKAWSTSQGWPRESKIRLRYSSTEPILRPSRMLVPSGHDDSPGEIYKDLHMPGHLGTWQQPRKVKRKEVPSVHEDTGEIYKEVAFEFEDDVRSHWTKVAFVPSNGLYRSSMFDEAIAEQRKMKGVEDLYEIECDDPRVLDKLYAWQKKAKMNAIKEKLTV